MSRALLLSCFSEERLIEEGCEDQVEVSSATNSNLHNPAEADLPTGDAGADVHPEVTPELGIQKEQQPIPKQSQEAGAELHKLESEGKKEKEDQVETFFSSMSNRYEEPLAL